MQGHVYSGFLCLVKMTTGAGTSCEAGLLPPVVQVEAGTGGSTSEAGRAPAQLMAESRCAAPCRALGEGGPAGIAGSGHAGPAAQRAQHPATACFRSALSQPTSGHAAIAYLCHVAYVYSLI